MKFWGQEEHFEQMGRGPEPETAYIIGQRVFPAANTKQDMNFDLCFYQMLLYDINNIESHRSNEESEERLTP